MPIEQGKERVPWNEDQILVADPAEVSVMPTLQGYCVVIVDIYANTSLTTEIVMAQPKYVVASRVADAWNTYQDIGGSAWVIGDVDQRPEFATIATKASNSPFLFTQEQTAKKLLGQDVIIATNNGTASMCLALDRQANAVFAASLRNIEVAEAFLQH